MCYTVIDFLAILSVCITNGVRRSYIVTMEDLKIIISLTDYIVLNFNKLDHFSCLNPFWI